MVNLLSNVHVINLQRSKDRLEHIDKNLREFGITYKRYDAVDGKELSIKEIDSTTTKVCRYLLCSRPTIGCALSHIGLWKEISESNDKWHLVLEDDVEFTRETIDFFDKLGGTQIMCQDN